MRQFLRLGHVPIQQFRLALVRVSDVGQLPQQVFQVFVFIQLISLCAQYQGVQDPVRMCSFRGVCEQPRSVSGRKGPNRGLAPVVCQFQSSVFQEALQIFSLVLCVFQRLGQFFVHTMRRCGLFYPGSEGIQDGRSLFLTYPLLFHI